MNSLRIRDDGVLLQGPPGKNAGPLPAQAFTLSLNDSVIENMIKCYQDGQELSLALGASPVRAGLPVMRTYLGHHKAIHYRVQRLTLAGIDISLRHQIPSRF
jgi:hypothetical protein